MLTNEWTFIEISAAEFEQHKLCAIPLTQNLNQESAGRGLLHSSARHPRLNP
jgi:hypothetical protein